MTQRLIEKWLPIAELGIESLRERTPMTPFPAPNRLHVWWARRPLVASRAAVLASLLPADADRKTFMHVLGIHGDPVAAKVRIARATRAGERLGADAYGYRRAFTYCPEPKDHTWIGRELARSTGAAPVVLDPTAGGGSIPFEALRLGLPTLANDLNPVAALILRATVEWPLRDGHRILSAFRTLGAQFVGCVRDRLAGAFPDEAAPDTRPDAYLWARTITCPACDGLIPLSPNWRLSTDGAGVRLLPDSSRKVCSFEIVHKATDQSAGTVAGGSARCPYPDCARIIAADEVRAQARERGMGDQLYAVVFKRRAEKTTKTGKRRIAWERGFRAPESADDPSRAQALLAEALPSWEALDLLPTEPIPTQHPKYSLDRWGVSRWTELFSPRQLLTHGTAVQLFNEQLAASNDDPTQLAAFAYLALALDKLRDYNSRMTRWHVPREVVVNTFDSHNFAMRWSYVEMAPLIAGLGYDWAVEQTAKCLEELVEMARPDLAGGTSAGGLFAKEPPPVTVTCGPGDNLKHVKDASVDAVVMDPPYYDNVMYAELSDFFYVWLKRTAGHIFPELFRRRLTDKDAEAVANPAKFKGQPGAMALASRDYQERMAAIFAECRRVLKPDGILTLMFTHKATGAWDALASGLMVAGFTITASWPINTEAEGSLHIKEKSAANSTIFLVCRLRPDRPVDETHYWEDVEPLVAKAVRARVEEFQKAGIGGVDLYLSCFGPALEEFARHWPMRRGQPRPVDGKKNAKAAAEPLDPYAVSPEDALDAARREVKQWRLEKLLRTQRRTSLDAMSEWFVLAWDAFRAPAFPYDEGLRLARVVGVDLDGEIVGRLAEKKGSDLLVWDSAKRAAKHALGAADGSRSMLDALHHVAHRIRQQSVQSGRELVEKQELHQDEAFATALQAVLEVLPVSSTFTKVEEEAGPVAEAAGDFDALERLRRLMFTERVPEPEQLRIWTESA